LSDKKAYLQLTRSGLKKVNKYGVAESVSPDSCYTEDFIDRLNDHDFVGVSDYSNEIFLYFYVRLVEFCELLQASNHSRCSLFPRFFDKTIFSRARVKSGHKVFLGSRIFNFVLGLSGFLFAVVAIISLSILLPFYLVRKKEFNKSIKYDCSKNSIFIIRSKAAYQKSRVKMQKADSALIVLDNYSGLDVPGLSIYSVINWKNSIKISVKSALFSLKDIKGFLRDGKTMLGATCSLALLPRYIKRISHKSVYESCLEEVIRSFPSAVFFTGDKDDRFALLQTRVCKREKKQLFCLPHGLEYGFRFPGGLAGTTFYCFTPEAASFLNHLYQESKFVYSESVTDEMYGTGFEKQTNGRIERLCFFTEPRDPEINYKIITELTERNVKLSLKLHPLEKSEDYRKLFPDIEQIDEFTDAICSTVCLARKSTVLLEATRRGAKSIAVLVNEKDRAYVLKIFPSLRSESILRAFTFDELQDML